MDYNVDMGSSSDSDEDGGNNPTAVLDSDEEERIENTKILKMLSMKLNSADSSKTQKKIVDFEAEMEAELDRRAFIIENEGGMEHQRSLSRSSSSSSLHSLPRTGISSSFSDLMPCSSGSTLKQITLPSSVELSTGSSAPKKSVKFLEPEPSSSSTSKSLIEEGKQDEEFYDKVYFDSDESEGEDDVTKKKKTSKRKFMTNDDLFYDPNSDAEDQAWIDRRRRKQYYKPIPKKLESTVVADTGSKAEESKSSVDSNERPSGTSGTSTIESPAVEIPLPSSDAVLNCPACFSVLSLDCQRHEFYVGQYRAMFVMNCKIDRSETLKVPLKNNKGRRKNAKRDQSEILENLSKDPDDTFFPVQCTVCNTQVAMYDREEIYHFFNCLASHP